VQRGNLRAIKSRRRAWTGFVVALTVSFTVCDGEQISAAPSYASSVFSYFASFQMERPEQKAPCDLAFWRLAEDSGMNRSLVASGSRVMGDEPGFQYVLSAARPWLKLFGWHINAFESPRAPPL
jgi:hypothetical protein